MAMEEVKTPHRPRSRVFKAQDGDRPQLWTASRCHRSLRPLVSRIAVLRSDVKTVPVQAQVCAETQPRPQGKRLRAASDLPGKRKRVRHTYSQRCADKHTCDQSGVERRSARFRDLQHAEAGAHAPGEMTACTPLLRRARGEQVASPEQEMDHSKSRRSFGRSRNSGINGETINVDLDVRLASMRSGLSLARYGDYEAIFRSFEALLKATRHDTTQKRGASTFLDMCLRKMPAYISGVEAWVLHEAEKNGTKSTLDSSDMSFRIYSDLESLSPAPSGWRHLRTVVRSHGLKAVEDAMAEGLFTDDFSELLIDLCVVYRAAAEVDGLIEVFVSLDREYPYPQSPESTFKETPSFRPLLFIWDFSHKTGRISCLFRQYTKLLSNDLLPHEWLVTREFERVWSLANRIISRGDGAADAVAFLAAAITILCRKIRHSGMRTSDLDMMASCKKRVSNALAVLSAMHLLGDNELQVDSSLVTKLDSVSNIGRNLAYIFHACVAEIGVRKGKRPKLGSDLLHLALFLSSPRTLLQDEAKGSLRNAIESTCSDLEATSYTKTKRGRHNYDTLVLLISSIAKICGRGTSQACHDHLERLCEQLRRLDLQEDTLVRLKRAGAFIIAQQTNDLRDLVYAEKLVYNTLSAANSDENRAPTQTLFVGYRWEDTIGEWVTVSPPMERNLSKRRSLRSSSVMKADMGTMESILRAGELSARPTSLTSLVASRPEDDVDAGCGKMSNKRCSSSTTQKTNPAGGSLHFNGETIEVPSCAARNDTNNHTSSQTTATDDELGEDKENHYQETGRRHRPKKVVLGKRHIRLSVSAECHSDDELGI